jgi:rod shape-determining protein MreC
MRNLIAFFQRFRLFLVFIALQVIALTMMVNMSVYANLQFFSTTSRMNAGIFSLRQSVDKHFYLETQNQRLARENAYMHARLKQSNYQVERNITFIEDTTYKRKYKYIPGTVIQSTYDKRNNYMTIDLGSNHGVKKGDGVISTAGVVGIVHMVGTDYSLVKTVLSQNINQDVMLEKNGAFGLMKWDQKSPRVIQIEGISSDIYFKKWVKVVTRGSAGVFPKGIPVGVVKNRKKMEDRPLWYVDVLLTTDFRTIQQIYVVKNLHQEEIDKLQRAIPVDKDED